MTTEAKIEITASTARLPAGLRSAMKQVQGFVAATTGLFGKQKKDLDERAMARGAFWGGLASGVAMRGIDVMIDQGKEVLKFQDELTRFGVATNTSGAALDSVSKKARDVSSETGKSALEVLRGARAYVDLAGAQSFTAEKMALLSRAAQATGADSRDMAGVMYQLTRSMKIKDAALMEETIGGLANQAKDGAIEMREMSKEFAGLMPLAARFGLTGREGAIQIGAMYQVLRDGFNSASEAATGLERILAGIPSHASKFEKAGVRIWNVGKDGTKTLRSWSEIFTDIRKSDLMKDPEKLKKAFGRTEGWRGFLLLVESMERLAALEEAGRKNGVVMQDLATITEGAAGRIDVAIERLKNHFADMLTPERIDSFVAGIESMAAGMQPLIDTAGVAVDLFGKIYDAGGWLATKVSGGMHYDTKKMMSPEDRELLDTFLIPGGEAGLSKEQLAHREELRTRVTAYNAMMDDIESSTTHGRPTDAAIKKALLAANADAGPDVHDPALQARGWAARNWLSVFDKDISEPRIRRLAKELQAQEDEKRRANFTLENAQELDRARVRNALGPVNSLAPLEAMQGRAEAALYNPEPSAPPIMSDVGAQLDRALRNFAPVLRDTLNSRPMVINIDGNRASMTINNATDQRRGGK